MKNIFKACKDAAKEYNTTIQGGANIAGFLKVSFSCEMLCSAEPRLCLSVAALLCCPGLDSIGQLQLCAGRWMAWLLSSLEECRQQQPGYVVHAGSATATGFVQAGCC